MENNNNLQEAPQPKKKDALLTKKTKFKKILVITLSVFLSLALLAGVLPWVLELVRYEEDYGNLGFFPVDYERNILNDELYLMKNREIYYNNYGSVWILNEKTLEDLPGSAEFFYDYFHCIINGDYQNYPNYFTTECLNDPMFKCPEKFTMQGLYDIHIEAHSIIPGEDINNKTEIFKVRYRIFENNGSFRNDIAPDDTRTLAFEIKIVNGVCKINAISEIEFISSNNRSE